MTNHDRFAAMDWWRTAPGSGMCRHCQEDRLISRVEYPYGVQHVCSVCSHAWWVEQHDPPRTARGHPIRD